MKTFIKSLVSALFLTVALYSPILAIDDHGHKKVFGVAVFPTVDASKLWVVLEKYQSENTVNLQLVNQRGEVLHQEILLGKRSRQNACRQQFDISQLPDGNYKFQITAGTQKEEIQFQLGTPAKQEPTRLIAIK
jgi:flagellar hook assembly protein FlgD